jgi:ribonuclease VapC
MPAVVLDAFALLAWLQDEPGAEQVEAYLAEASAGRAQVLISAINLGEVYYLLARRQAGATAEALWQDLRRGRVPLRAVPATWSRVRAAARLKARFLISYADAFAAALALERSAPLVTGDPEFGPLERGAGLQVVWLAGP